MSSSLQNKKQASQKPSKVSYEVREPFTKGAKVKVVSARTEGKRGLSFTYLRHAVNTETDSTWVDVLDKDGKIVSFHVDEVSLVVVKPKRKYTRRKA